MSGPGCAAVSAGNATIRDAQDDAESAIAHANATFLVVAEEASRTMEDVSLALTCVQQVGGSSEGFVGRPVCALVVASRVFMETALIEATRTMVALAQEMQATFTCVAQSGGSANGPLSRPVCAILPP